jgi:chemotaxis protein histidine kinase CheA
MAMAPPPPHDLLDFYVVEATEYIDRIDGLVTRAGSSAPEGQALVSAARALRGSSTMAKAEGMATLALAVEHVARGVRDGNVAWTPLIQGALVSAVDDLRILLRNLRVWGPHEQTRATFRVEELRELIPGENPLGTRLTPTPAAGTATPVFISLQASAIASALEQYLKNPGERHALDDALARVRTLRGIAAVSELPPLGDVADLVERAIVALPAGAKPNAQQKELLFSAAAVLTRAADELRSLGKPALSTPELARFAAAAALNAGAESAADAIVPIEDLYFSDNGPHIVQRGTVPAVSATERFRKETVSRAEHLARLVAEARAATTDVGRERAERELRNTLRQLEQTAAALGERAAEAFFGEAAMAPAILSPRRLTALDAAAQLLLAPANAELSQALASLTRSLTTPPSTAATAATPTPPAAPRLTPPAQQQSAPRRSSITPTGNELRALLQTGIAGFQSLAQAPLSEPASIGDDDIVPIESLLYRGRAALDRAIVVRDELQRVRAAGGTPDDAALAELFDLLELARRE